MAILNSVKAAQVMAGPGLYALVAEACVLEENGKKLYVTWQNFEGEGGSVSEESMYGFLAEDATEPVQNFSEEYDDITRAKEESQYGKVFDLLYQLIEKLGEEVG